MPYLPEHPRKSEDIRQLTDLVLTAIISNLENLATYLRYLRAHHHLSQKDKEKDKKSVYFEQLEEILRAMIQDKIKSEEIAKYHKYCLKSAQKHFDGNIRDSRFHEFIGGMFVSSMFIHNEGEWDDLRLALEHTAKKHQLVCPPLPGMKKFTRLNLNGEDNDAIKEIVQRILGKEILTHINLLSEVVSDFEDESSNSYDSNEEHHPNEFYVHQRARQIN